MGVKKMCKVMALLLVGIFVFGLTSPVLAHRMDDGYAGVPTAFRPGSSMGIFIWQDHNGWHLRTTTKGSSHSFSGTIRTDGNFSRASSVGTEDKDKVRVASDREKINFSFDTAGGVDGIDFRLSNDSNVKFELYIDGRQAPVRYIFLGQGNDHPNDNTFQINRDRESHRYYEGKPTRYMPGLSQGDYIWHDSNGWHVRTSTFVTDRRYTGEIRTDGEIYDVKAIDREGSDRVRVDSKRDIIRFNFYTASGIDGLDFRVKDARYIEFNLMLDGQPIERSRVYIGRDNAHPNDNQFRIRL